MSNKKMYNPKDIYFGSLTYNTYTDGYYYSSPEPFKKIVAENGEILYKQLNSRCKVACKEFYEGIKDAVSVQYLTPLAKLMSEEKQNEPISRKLISLYLLKYRVRFNKYNKLFKNIDELSKDNQKIKK